jgi:hypothetical protein
MILHFTRVRPSDSLMAKDIIFILASAQSLVSSISLVKVLGVDKKNIRKAIMRRVLMDTQNDSFWICYIRATRSDVLPESVRLLVMKWSINQSTIFLKRK